MICFSLSLQRLSAPALWPFSYFNACLLKPPCFCTSQSFCVQELHTSLRLLYKNHSSPPAGRTVLPHLVSHTSFVSIAVEETTQHLAAQAWFYHLAQLCGLTEVSWMVLRTSPSGCLCSCSLVAAGAGVFWTFHRLAEPFSSLHGFSSRSFQLGSLTPWISAHGFRQHKRKS